MMKEKKRDPTEFLFTNKIEKSRSYVNFNETSSNKLKAINLNRLMNETFSRASNHTIELLNTNKISRELLPKLNKSPLSNASMRTTKWYVLPEFKPQAQIIGEKMNLLNMRFIQIGRRPEKEINMGPLHTKKAKKAIEIRNLNSFDLYKKRFSRLFSQIKKLNNNILV